MAPRFVLALLAVAFGVAVIGATSPLISKYASVHSAARSGPALIRPLNTTSIS
jgi:hypothetical protein